MNAWRFTNKHCAELKEDGHEIVSHGALHVNARNYILKNGYNNYLSKEIDASILAMRTEKFEPTSFAYPFGAKFLLTDYLLLKKFNVLRGVADLRGKEDITSRPEIYYNFNHDRTLSALSIDQSSGLTKKMVRQGINRAKETKQEQYKQKNRF